MRAKVMAPGVRIILTAGLLELAAAGGAGTSQAATPLDAADCSVQCLTFSGKTTFSPPLTDTGIGPSDLIKLRGVVGGCTVSGATCAGLTVLSGKVLGTLNGTTDSCAALLGTSITTGELVVKWKTNQPLLDSTSQLSLNAGSVVGTLFPGLPPGVYGQFLIGGPVTVSGAFHGSDGGATSTATVVSSEDVSALSSACASSKGLKGLTIGLGNAVLQ